MIKQKCVASCTLEVIIKQLACGIITSCLRQTALPKGLLSHHFFVISYSSHWKLRELVSSSETIVRSLSSSYPHSPVLKPRFSFYHNEGTFVVALYHSRFLTHRGFFHIRSASTTICLFIHLCSPFISLFVRYHSLSLSSLPLWACLLRSQRAYPWDRVPTELRGTLSVLPKGKQRSLYAIWV